jgi:hypothetical protein
LHVGLRFVTGAPAREFANFLASPANNYDLVWISAPMFRFSVTTPTGRPDWRFLPVVFIFGLAVTAGGVHWLTSGQIEIRAGKSRSRAVAQPAYENTAPQSEPGAVAGRITSSNLLYYPLCTAWVSLGTAMIVLPLLAFFRGQFYARLAAYCCAALLLLTAVTVGAALWSGS